MDLNHIEFTSGIIADLYHNTLIDSSDGIANVQPKNPAIGVIKPRKEQKYLGTNQKNIVLFVNYPETVHLPDDDLSFLTNMLSACKLSLADVAIVNLNNYTDETRNDILAHFETKIALLFGLDATSINLPISIPNFQIQSFSKRTFLFAPSVKEFDNNKAMKGKLWVCLRKVFNI